MPWDRWIQEGGGAAGAGLRSQAEHDWSCMTANASEAYALLRTTLEVQGADLAILGPGDEEGWGWQDRPERLLQDAGGRISKEPRRAAPFFPPATLPRRAHRARDPGAVTL